jgi:hypothetical protein
MWDARQSHVDRCANTELCYQQRRLAQKAISDFLTTARRKARDIRPVRLILPYGSCYRPPGAGGTWLGRWKSSDAAFIVFFISLLTTQA